VSHTRMPESRAYNTHIGLCDGLNDSPSLEMGLQDLIIVEVL